MVGMEREMIPRVASLSDMVLGFFEEREGEDWDRNCYQNLDDDGVSDDEGEAGAPGGSSAESKAFWETQHRLLQEALSRSSSAEARIKRDTEEAVGKMQSTGFDCACSTRPAKECRSCALRRISEQLRDAGYNSALCKSKWTRSPDIPSGEHSYIDVVIEAKSAKRSPIRVVIELNFRAEFEMARGSREYNSLVSRLPEVFVGKTEKLRNVIKIMCGAAKKCTKDNKMHLGPWRKHKYMQSKWLGTPERLSPGSLLVPAGVSDRPPKLRASMLTFDLHCTAVGVRVR